MQCILVIAQVQSYLLISIKERFVNASYNVVEVSADIDAVNGIGERISCVLFYADDTLAKEQQFLYYLKDRAIAEDIPIFLVGEGKDVHAIKSVLSNSLVKQEFLRPINVGEVVSSIDRIMTKINQNIKKKILVVDDSGAMLRAVKGWLEDKYSVFLANSGTMTIKYITLNRPDLILLDYDMPVCDGKQVLEMIRAETEFADIPVMFLTHKEDTISIVKVKPLKPEAYLLKSMEPAQIVKAVDDFFEMQKGLRS